ncbi:SDR family NAD(P)-dependent oxidoreductase [Minwuia sp.]|uniref:SDR family NAD(P)-dependent oxidoreductase n=1 Tax=Minwuia sp. TaxID=2493630 RepID=UPI003A9221E0
MSRKLDGKVAAITGGASGMGRATVMRYLEEGASVAIGDLNAHNGAETLKAAEDAGFADRVIFVRGDVAEEGDVEALVGGAVEKFGRLDIMFNNAGVGGAFGPITETTVEEWDYTFNVLVRGVFLGVKHAVRQMKKQGDGGAVINTASIAGLSGGAGPNAYSAAKAAVHNLTRVTAAELAQDRIRINAIAPGAIRTPLLHSGRAAEMDAIAQDKTPWPVLGEGTDIAGAAVFLASDDSQFVTGHTLVVDGGALAASPNFWGFGADSLFKKHAGMNRGSTGEKSYARDIERK